MVTDVVDLHVVNVIVGGICGIVTLTLLLTTELLKFTQFARLKYSLIVTCTEYVIPGLIPDIVMAGGLLSQTLILSELYTGVDGLFIGVPVMTMFLS